MDFHEAFSDLVINEELERAFNDTSVEKVVVSKLRGEITVILSGIYPVSRSHIISMQNVLKKQIFTSKEQTVLIEERYDLSDFSIKHIFEKNKTNILEELNEQGKIYYNILNNSEIDFDETKTANIKPFHDVIPDVIPDGYQMDTQVRIGKDRLDKDRLELDKVNNLNYTGVENEKKSFSQIIKESNIKLNDRQTQMLLDYVGLDNMTIEMIQYAVELTEDAGANNFNYLNKILKSWREKQLTSLDAVKKDIEEFEIRKSNPSADNPAVFKPYRDELPF